MRKKLTLLCAVLLLVSITASAQREEGRQRRGPMMPPRGAAVHPLMFALESDDFTAEERTSLRALAEKDPAAFSQAMRRHFLEKRCAEAKRILELRGAYLKAATKEEKEKALAELRSDVARDARRRLAFQKRLLDETEKSIAEMRKRLDSLRTEYENSLKNGDAEAERRISRILSDNPPPRLLKEASWTPGQPDERPEPPQEKP